MSVEPRTILTLPDREAWTALGVSPDAEEAARYHNHATYLARLHYWDSGFGEYPGLTVAQDHVEYHLSATLTISAPGRIVDDDGQVVDSYYQ